MPDICVRASVIVRDIRPADAARLVAFHERLSTESQRLRFFSFHPHLQPAEVQRFVEVDGVQRAAVVADLDDEIVGVARLDREGSTDVAEIAVVVQDELQGHGLGRMLLERLVAHARQIGITRLTAVTLPENDRVRTLFRCLGYPMTSRYATGVVEVSMELGPPQPARRWSRSGLERGTHGRES